PGSWFLKSYTAFFFYVKNYFFLSSPLWFSFGCSAEFRDAAVGEMASHMASRGVRKNLRCRGRGYCNEGAYSN
ncbi:hypothetical protein, partial [Enterococcus faecalis]|uniref:hypothetical protein n=1 Tax=Enterococcus faecalis TaxID=1351 RepID=UPI003D6C2099